MFEHREHVGFQAIARDMTQHKRVERALRDGPRRRRGRQPRQERIPGQHEPRDPHADERRDRHDAARADDRAHPTAARLPRDRAAVRPSRCSGILNSILDFSKIESRKLEMESVPFALRDLLADTLKPLGFAADQKQLELLSTSRRTCPTRSSATD